MEKVYHVAGLRLNQWQWSELYDVLKFSWLLWTEDEPGAAEWAYGLADRDMIHDLRILNGMTKSMAELMAKPFEEPMAARPSLLDAYQLNEEKRAEQEKEWSHAELNQDLLGLPLDALEWTQASTEEWSVPCGVSNAKIREYAKKVGRGAYNAKDPFTRTLHKHDWCVFTTNSELNESEAMETQVFHIQKLVKGGDDPIPDMLMGRVSLKRLSIPIHLKSEMALAELLSLFGLQLPGLLYYPPTIGNVNYVLGISIYGSPDPMVLHRVMTWGWYDQCFIFSKSAKWPNNGPQNASYRACRPKLNPSGCMHHSASKHFRSSFKRVKLFIHDIDSTCRIVEYRCDWADAKREMTALIDRFARAIPHPFAECRDLVTLILEYSLYYDLHLLSWLLVRLVKQAPPIDCG